MNPAAPNHYDFNAVYPEEVDLDAPDRGGSCNAALVRHDESVAAAEQAQEDQESAEVVKAARRNS